MKLYAYRTEQGIETGIGTEYGVLSVRLAAEMMGAVLDHDPMIWIRAGVFGRAILESLCSTLQVGGVANLMSDCLFKEEDLDYVPCVPAPGKILCVGLNYRKHAEETGASIPESPVVFGKFSNALSAHSQDILIPETSTMVDYEAELAIVIGQKTRSISTEDALSAVFGYCTANDVSARDLQKRTSQWLLGKTCDGFCPLGPCLVTADEVPNPDALAIRSTVNGQQRQSSNTKDMIFSCAEIISYISQHMTLEPGDVILTGTPEGVVFGMPPEKQVYLADGDVVTVEVEGLGELRNRMVGFSHSDG